jgi:hypothetical protein
MTRSAGVPVLTLLDAHIASVGAESLGRGPDPYESRPIAHPMALALYAEGLATLSDQGVEREWLMVDLADRLLELASGETMAWGLGFDWRGGDGSAPYAITTAACGRALLSVYRTTGGERYGEAADRAADWLRETLPWTELPGTGHRGPAYSLALPHALPNVASVVAGFLAEAAALLDARHADLAAEALQAVMAAQRRGYWTYGDTGTKQGDGALPGDVVVDLIHTSYALAGLAGCIVHLPKGASAAAAAAGPAALRDGIEFAKRHLATADGWCREKVVIADVATPLGEELANRPRLRRREIDDGVWAVAFPAESRLWGYGAWIEALARAEAAGQADAADLLPVLEYVWSVVATDPSARFPLTSADRGAYPRHEAHLFLGLALARPMLGEGIA